MRIVYLGTPQVAVPPLIRLHRAGHEIALVVTNPDRRRGRGSELLPSAVKAAALDLGLPVTHRTDDIVDMSRSVDIELGVVVAFGQIIRPPVLDVVPMINLHFSLLPRWRGAAPVERAVLEGDDITGVCVMRVEESLDTGGIYARADVPIGSDTSVDELRSTLVDIGADLLVQTLARPTVEWLDSAEPQIGEPTYARKLTPAERRIDWNDPADVTSRRIRLGGAWTTFRDRRLIIQSSSTVDGQIVPTVVQPEGKPAMSFDDWRRGARPAPDELFGTL